MARARGAQGRVGCHRRIAREIKKIVVRENGMILPEATNLDPRFAIDHITDGPLTSLVTRFLDEDYGRFDALCRRPSGNSTANDAHIATIDRPSNIFVIFQRLLSRD